MPLFAFQGSSYTGTDDEKLKCEKLEILSHNLLQLEIRTNYLKTFEGMCFIPLAIQNVSAVQDTDIRVVVQVETGEIVEPSENLIWSEYADIQGLFCRDDEDESDIGMICELFALTEDGTIHTEEIPFNPSRYIPKAPVITAGGLSQPNKAEKEYKLELEEFIALTDGRGYYEFDVASLRPGECRCSAVVCSLNRLMVKSKFIIEFTPPALWVTWMERLKCERNPFFGSFFENGSSF